MGGLSCFDAAERTQSTLRLSYRIHSRRYTNTNMPGTSFSLRMKEQCLHCIRHVAHGILHITEIELPCAHCIPILHFSRCTLHRNILQAVPVLHAFFAYCVPAFRAIVAHACVTLQCSLAMTGFSKLITHPVHGSFARIGTLHARIQRIDVAMHSAQPTCCVTRILSSIHNRTLRRHTWRSNFTTHIYNWNTMFLIRIA